MHEIDGDKGRKKGTKKEKKKNKKKKPKEQNNILNARASDNFALSTQKTYCMMPGTKLKVSWTF
jgi:hypothetical protein